jgi:hypothetical protein
MYRPLNKMSDAMMAKVFGPQRASAPTDIQRVRHPFG